MKQFDHYSLIVKQSERYIFNARYSIFFWSISGVFRIFLQTSQIILHGANVLPCIFPRQLLLFLIVCTCECVEEGGAVLMSRKFITEINRNTSARLMLLVKRREQQFYVSKSKALSCERNTAN